MLQAKYCTSSGFNFFLKRKCNYKINWATNKVLVLVQESVQYPENKPTVHGHENSFFLCNSKTKQPNLDRELLDSSGRATPF